MQHAQTRADKIALSIIDACGSEDWTYAQLNAAILGVGTGLLSTGCVSGGRVVIRLGNRADFPIAFLGCIAVGLIPVPLSMQFTQAEVLAITARIKPAAAITEDTWHIGAQISVDLLALQGFYGLSPAHILDGDPNSPAYFIHTSGTSGMPRAVVHAHRAVWARRMMWDDWYGLRDTDRMLHAGAFNWTYTLGTGLMDPWAIGATALIPRDDTAAADLPALMARHRATIFAAAPGVYRRLLRADMPALPDLRHGLCAGEKLPLETQSTWENATDTAVHEAFGMSECSTFISGCPARPAPVGTSGFAQMGRKLAILTDGAPVARDVVGNIAIHTSDPGLMLGYLDGDQIIPPAGDWFETGDMGQMGADGAISYAGRRDDMMNAGGYRVSPIEVETALSAHPNVQDVGAVTVTVKKDVMVIAVFYTSTTVLDEEVLRDWCAARLAPYKMPRLFVTCDELPRGANNKLLRRILRHNWETAHGQT